MVQAAEGVSDLADRTVKQGGIGDIGCGRRHRYAMLAEALRGVGEAARVACDEAYRRPLGGERLGHREADATASARDQRTGSAKPSSMRSTLLVPSGVRAP